jgi:hypothetical protein
MMDVMVVVECKSRLAQKCGVKLRKDVSAKQFPHCHLDAFRVHVLSAEKLRGLRAGAVLSCKDELLPDTARKQYRWRLSS